MQIMLWLLISVSIVYGFYTIVAIYLVVIAARNYEAHQFFKLKTPDLPVLPEPSIFGGHYEILYHSRSWKLFEDYHKKYGKTFGFFYCASPFVSTIDLNFMKTFVLDEPNDHINRTNLYLPSKLYSPSNIIIAEDDTWRRLRKVVGAAFASHKIKSAELQEEIRESVGRFVESFDNRLKDAKEKGSKSFEIDAADIFHRFALDIVFKCFFNEKNAIDFEAKNDYYRTLIYKARQPLFNIAVKLSIMFPVVNWLVCHLSTLLGPQALYFQKILTLIENQTKLNLRATNELQKLNKTSESIDADKFTFEDGYKFKRSLNDYIIDQYHEGIISYEEYVHTMFFLFFASNTTTGDALSRIIYHLALHQDTQAKLRESILADKEESEYLTWCIHESMRLFPPAQPGSSRTITRDINTEVGLVPKGTYVSTPGHTINRLKEYWGEDADEFKPERWKNAKSFHPLQYLSFGAGRRICPGKDLALKEMQMLLATLIPLYSFELSPETTEETVNQFQSPAFLTMIDEKPTLVRVSRFELENGR